MFDEQKKKKFIAITLLILMILISFPILSYFKIWHFNTIYEVLKEIANFLYLISGFLLIIGLYLTISQINILKTQVKDQAESTNKQLEYIKVDMRTRNHRAAVEKSIDYLSIFANDIFPKIQSYWDSLDGYRDINVPGWNPSKTDYRLDLLSLSPEVSSTVFQELQKRRNAGLIEILNNIEFVSAGIIHGLGKEEVVYDPIATSYITFIKREIIEISSQRHLGNPFENTIKLFILWETRRKTVADSLQAEELESIIKKKESELDASKTALAESKAALSAKRAEIEVAASTSKPIDHIGKFD